MIFYLGGNHMIIKKLTVMKLHGLYDYTVRFHDDLTFLYGENGCGKTTILNIISSIVTGELYSLSSYRFDTITLAYYDPSARRSHTLHIKSEDNGYLLRLNPQGKEERIPLLVVDPDYSENNSISSLRQKYMRSYEFPQLLRSTFSYLYLPLSRYFQGETGMGNTLSRYRYASYAEREFVGGNYLNDSLSVVRDLIRRSRLRISAKENDLDAEFRNAVLSSALKIASSSYDIKNLMESVADEESLKKIEQGREKYIERLESIDEYDSTMQESIQNFFSKYEGLFQRTQRTKKEQGRMELTVELLLMSKEFDRMMEVASIAQGFEKKKEQVREPLFIFNSTINRFFHYNAGEKRVSIGNDGKLTVMDSQADRTVRLSQLSSGEKQLLIIFSFLLFGLSSDEHGIYIIDEPEASLHLAWQKIFVESIREAKPSLQLILATHSPEIIGRYADRAVRLQKKINPSPASEEDVFDE